MSKAGDELENPVTGERAVVRQGTEDTGGQRVVTDLYLRPGGRVVGAHVHSYLEERFEVVDGRVAFQTLWGLAADGKTNAKGMPNLLQLAATATEFRPEFELLRPPRAVQRLLFGVLAPIARARGYRGIYPYPGRA